MNSPATSRPAALARLLLPALLLMASPGAALPVPCDTGTLDFSAESDTPFVLPTFNVGQKVTLKAIVTGFTATSYSWSIPGPLIKDYNDNLGTQVPGPLATPMPWSTTPMAPADLTSAETSFYFKPSPAQVHPLNGGPEARMVTLTVTPMGGGNCVVSSPLMVERNATDSSRQAEDFYTSNHRAPMETNPGLGHVIDEHIYWHQFVGGGANGHWLQFLAWHGYFVRRFDDWRAEFGYPRVAPWYPGRPLPTGPEFDHPAALRLVFNPDNNRIPTYYTLAGGSTADFGGQMKLADYASLNAFSNAFESSYHGDVHCNIGTAVGGFFATSGPGFGSMCKASSPKDPMFWRWHGFIDTLYRNYCRLKSLSCHSGPDPASDPWMADNAADIAAVGTVPSPSPRWTSPDVWNRLAPVTTDACIPRLPPPDLNTVGGIDRDCGSAADHENPVEGVQNYLYATLRNTRPSPSRTVYVEVAVYIAAAATGLSWPTDFTMLPETRQFLTLHLEPGQVTDIGPLPWVPPSPMPSDHFCLYLRVLSVQETPPVEGVNVDTNVANSNSIAWRNVKIVHPGMRKISKFIVRNIRERPERLSLDLELPPELLRAGTANLQLDPALLRAFEAGQGKLEGLRFGPNGGLTVLSPKARVDGLLLDPQKLGTATFELRDDGAETEGDVVITQSSSAGIDGGVVLRVARLEVAPTEDPKPDLEVRLRGPSSARAGSDISSRVRILVSNQGDTAAKGTDEVSASGYFVDLVLSADRNFPSGFATFSETFREDALLRGGRISNTRSLEPGEVASYRGGVFIPRDTPPGNYCLAAIVDPGRTVSESDESNNTTCLPLRIVAHGF